MGAHQDVAGVQVPIQEELLGVGDVDTAEGCFGQGVGRDQSQTVKANLVYAVDCLEGKPGNQVKCWLFENIN